MGGYWKTVHQKYIYRHNFETKLLLKTNTIRGKLERVKNIHMAINGGDYNVLTFFVVNAPIIRMYILHTQHLGLKKYVCLP